MKRDISIIRAAILMCLILTEAQGLKAGKPRKVKVTDQCFYEEIFFPGYGHLNAVWDLHASGPCIYIALCAEAPCNALANLFR